MKKQLLFWLIFILFAQQAVAQRSEVFFKDDLFYGTYSEVYQQPLKITYQVQCANGKISRKGLDFYTNDSIKTSDDLDYINNVYDKGHLAPAAAFNCDSSSLYKTFSYLNCVLQHEKLNRGLWKQLEVYERNLTTHGNVLVTVEVVFVKKPEKVSGGASIPVGFKKIITIDGGKKEVYYFPNKDPGPNKKLNDYKILL